MRFATRLPNASNESGLGLDTTDFYRVAAGRPRPCSRFASSATSASASWAIRRAATGRTTSLTYGLSFARAVTDAAEVVGEINGRMDTRNGDPPPGTESRSIVRFGARYTIGGWRGDAALLFGLTSDDPAIGFAAGFTYVFNAFSVP